MSVIERYQLTASGHILDTKARREMTPKQIAAGLNLCEHLSGPNVAVEQLQGAVDLLATFVDDEPCSLDHHSYCQTHVWLQEGECNVARARRIIGGQ